MTVVDSEAARGASRESNAVRDLAHAPLAYVEEALGKGRQAVEQLEGELNSLEAEAARLREELALAEDEARTAREACAEAWRDWAEGGRAWRMQHALDHLADELEGIVLPRGGVNGVTRTYLAQLIAVAKDPNELVTAADVAAAARTELKPKGEHGA